MPRGTSRYDEARLQGRLWTPRVYSADKLICWYDAQDFATISATSGVMTKWADKSGRGNHSLVAAGLTGPTFSPIAAPGVLPGLVYDATIVQGMSVASASIPTLTAINGFFVGTRASGGTNQYNRVLGFAATGGNDNTTGGIIPLLGFVDNVTLNSYVNGSFRSVKAITNGIACIAASIYDGTNTTVFSDGVAGTTVTTSGSALTLTKIGIGCAAGGSANDSWKGVYSESYALAGIISSAEQQRNEGYLAWKWGLVGNLPGSHPYKNRPPTIGG